MKDSIPESSSVAADEPGAFLDSILVSFLETAHVLKGRLEDALEAVMLSSAKYAVLRQLVEAGEPVPLSVLAGGQGCVPSNITQLVDRLEVEGLVRRIDDPADRRIVRAALTPLGEERAFAGTHAVAKVENAFASSLAPADRDVLMRALATMR